MVDWFVTERVWFHNALCIPALKHLKPDVIATIFIRSIDCLGASNSRETPSS